MKIQLLIIYTPEEHPVIRPELQGKTGQLSANKKAYGKNIRGKKQKVVISWGDGLMCKEKKEIAQDPDGSYNE